MTRFLASAGAQRESVTAVIIGRNSGVKPTAKATAKGKESKAASCRARLAASTRSTKRKTNRALHITEASKSGIEGGLQLT